MIFQHVAPAGVLARELEGDVHRALGELPEPMREALLLRFSESLAYEDIAAIVGASTSTVRSRVFHGLKRLQGHLTEWRRT
jgi:RNA polymerase sigma-70 factor, ECF subfamily